MSIWKPYGDPELVRELAAFTREKITPVADQLDRDDVYPTAILKQLAKQGLSSITLQREYGGKERSFLDAVALFEEVSVGSASVGVSLISTFQAQSLIHLFGNDSLKQRYLPQFCNGMLASYALTEANHGSDIRTLDTHAVLEGDQWRLDGEKSFITSASAAEFFLVLAQTANGVSTFAVPRDTPGMTLYEGSNSATFGLRNGPHLNLTLQNVRIPVDHLVGTEGKGVRQAVTTLDYSRTLAAAISIGIARAAFDSALEYTRRRAAFDRKVFDFQGIQWYFAEMLAEIDAARLLVYHAARALDAHEDIDRYSSAAKLIASELATKVASQAVQVCGAYGVQETTSFGRYLRDAKAYEIAGGSKEVLKNTLAKYLQKQEARPT
jgi:alkylation response protein AidB-like acyl-CoA dehydrogenase